MSETYFNIETAPVGGYRSLLQEGPIPNPSMVRHPNPSMVRHQYDGPNPRQQNDGTYTFPSQIAGAAGTSQDGAYAFPPQFHQESSRLTLLVEWEGRKVKVVTTRQNVVAEILRKVNPPVGFELMRWDSDFKEYIHMDVEDLEDMSQLKISAPAAAETTNGHKDGSLLDITNELSNEADKTPETPSSSRKRPYPQPVHSTPKPSILAGSYDFPIDAVPPSVLQILSHQLPLDENSRKALWIAAYNDVVPVIKYQFTHNVYTRIIDSLVKLYPYLAGNDTEAKVKNRKFVLKNQLQYYCQNTKGGRDRDLPEVAAAREAYTKKKAKRVNYVNTVKNIWGVTNFCPERLESEDDESIAAHMRNLDLQAQKRPCNRDQALIDLAMASTLSERRKYITKEGYLKSVAELKEMYKLLFSYEGINAEYERVMNSKLSEFEGRLGTIEEKLMSLRQKTKEPNYLVQLRLQITEVEDVLKRSYLKKMAGIFLIIMELKEDYKELFLTESEISSFPKLATTIPLDFNDLEDQEFQVVVEGVEVCRCPEFVEAVALLFGTYYVFNIQFPVKLKSTLAFFRRKLMDINEQVENVKPDKKLSRLSALLDI